ncbi:MAG TPA: hypothetical protein VGZ29_03800, partial [Terriglobia bacterium]|nr:hypothetical protein [Terriglobia bacterium]
IGEARIAIEETLDGGVGPGLAPALAGDEHRTPPEPALSEAKGAALRRALPWALFVLAALVAIVIGAWAWLAPRPATAPAALAYIPPPPGTSFRSFGFDAGPVVVSPGGKRLAFSATDQKGVTKIWIRALAGGEATALDETEDGSYPFWSPDGQSLGFIADEKLKTIMLSAGTIRVLADDSCPDTGGSWSSDGSILFIPQCGGPIAAISATGGTARPVVQPANEGRVVSPSFVPGGDELLYVSYESRHGSPSIRMASLTTGKSKPVMSDATAPQFASGHLLFMHEGKVFAQRFDPGNGKLKGDAVPVAEAQAYSASSNGVLAYQGGKAATRLEWFDRNGNSLGTLGSTGLWLAPKISPDGKHVLALAEDDGSADIWSYPAKTGVGSRLTFGPGYKGFAVWSPDGKYVAYVCYPAGALSLCRKPADGSGAEETLLKFAPEVASASAVDWSPDGRYLSFDQRTARPLRWSTWVLPLGGGEKPFQPAPVNENQYDGNFSLDGHWFAYFSYETGRPEVFVVPFPPSGGKFQVSQTGGWIVRWAAGDKLFFTTMGNRLMEADLATSGRSLQVQSIQPLFQLDLPTTSAPLYDVMPDASRFIVATSAEPGASQSITLLLNWQAELKDK